MNTTLNNPLPRDVLQIKVAAFKGQIIDNVLLARIDEAINNTLNYIKGGDEPDIDHNDLLVIIHGAKFSDKIKRVDKFRFEMRESFGGDHLATDLTIGDINLTVKWFAYMNIEKEEKRLEKLVKGKKQKVKENKYYDTIEDFYSWRYV